MRFSLRRRYSSVVGGQGVGAEFVDDGLEVSQGADGRQRGQVGWSNQPTQRSQQERRFDEFQRSALLLPWRACR